ncbi:radical SAM protein [Candidatus Shapirobacteria bacterium]|nr:radical SAM protein [Candidatus Shapirobacteria bacterium]
MNFIKKLKYSPINVQLIITRRCNLACGYCNEYDHQSLPVPKEKLIRYFSKLAELGTLSITFSGGEPLLHPDIVDLVIEAKKKIPFVAFITNAYLLTEELVKKLNEAKLSGVQISVDGVSPDKVTVKVLKFIKPKLDILAKSAKFSVNINSVIGSQKPEEAIEVIKYAKKCGFSTTIGLLHDSTGKLCLNEKQLKVYRELENERKVPFWDFGNFEKEFIKNGSSPFKCRSGSRYLYVDEFGKVRYCSQTFKMYEKDLLSLTESDLEDNFYRYKPCCEKCTIGCVRRASWIDQWRFQNKR